MQILLCIGIINFIRWNNSFEYYNRGFWCMKKSHGYIKSKSYDSLKDGIDYEAYYELFDNGLSDRDIAREMNISESFLKNIKKQAKEEF